MKHLQVFLAWLALSLPLVAQEDFRPPRIEPLGMDGFRLMLQQRGMETVQTGLASALASPEETVIVFLGDLREGYRIREDLENFVRDGGSLLVASDLGGWGADPNQAIRLPWLFGTQLYSAPMVFPKSSRIDGNFHDCPLTQDIAVDLEPTLFRDVEAIAANRPGFLETGQLRPLVWLPKPSPRRRQGRSLPNRPVLAAAGNVGQGRILLVADHSVFINQMLLHGDNARFANNVVDWLTLDGNRKRLVICLNNELLPEWSFVGRPPRVPLRDLLRNVERFGLAGLPANDALQIFDQSLLDFQRQTGMNSLVTKWSRAGRAPGPYNLQKPLIVLATLVCLIFARWLFMGRAKALSWVFPEHFSRSGQTRLAAALGEQQTLPVLRTLVREFFAEAGVTRFSEPNNYPIVEWSGEKNESRKLKRHAANVPKLWDLATSKRLPKIKAKQMETLTDQLRMLYTLHASGQLKLQ